MKISYTSSYLKIYLWQAISLVLNFISLFVVMPYLTNEPAIYGIYAVCVSVSNFLAYADFGFMAAGAKYASEFFAKGNIKQEITIIGFTSFILIIFLALFSSIFIYLSLNPTFLIKSLTTEREISIASSLLLTLALFAAPTIFLQRLLQLILGIRLEEYILQRTNIIVNTVKISSIFWFFQGGEHNIVGYFLFAHATGLLGCLVTLFIVRKRYHYSLRAVVNAIRFNQSAFSKTKSLAFASLYMTLVWILYYELDAPVIAKYFCAESIAIYAIGLTLFSFLRAISITLFSPFSARFNHFIGLDDQTGLKTFYLHITKVGAPVILIPILTLTLLTKPIILSWVGPHYLESITIVRYLILCYAFTFITSPATILLMAQKEIKKMYFTYTLVPIIFWVGIASTYSFLGIQSFAIFKLIAFSFSTCACFFIILNFLEIRAFTFVKIVIGPTIIPIVFLVVASLLIENYLPHEKSKINFLITITAVGIMINLAFLVQYLVSEEFKKIIKNWIKRLKNN